MKSRRAPSENIERATKENQKGHRNENVEWAKK
jgi:hypothetical protein